MNKITIVLLTYNRLELLKKAYNSCKNQTVKDFDLIIIDNCSDDGTVEYLKDLEKDNINKEIIFNEKNIGASNSLAKAFLKVKTEWVTILCDDDYFEKNYIEEMLKVIMKTKKHFIMASFCNIDEFGEKTTEFLYERNTLDLNEALYRVFALAKIEFAGISGFSIKINKDKREKLIKNEYPKGFLLDTFLCAEAIIEGNGMEILKESLYNRLIWKNSESAFSNENIKLYNEALIMFNLDMREIIKEKKIEKTVEKILSDYQPISQFLKITVIPLIKNGVITLNDIRDYRRIFNKNNNYKLHFFIIFSTYIFCNKYTINFRKSLVKFMKKIKNILKKV